MKKLRNIFISLSMLCLTSMSYGSDSDVLSIERALEKMEGVYIPFPVVTKVYYQVTAHTLGLNPPSCLVIAKRLKNRDAQMSQLDIYLRKIDQGESLTNSEVDSLVGMSKNFLPSLLDEQDQNVELDIKWTFEDVSQKSKPFKNAISKYGKIDYDYDGLIDSTYFQQYKLIGPGLNWNGEVGEEPSFLNMTLNGHVNLKYKVGILDFCFGENSIHMTGSAPAGFDSKTYSIYARWSREFNRISDKAQCSITADDHSS